MSIPAPSKYIANSRALEGLCDELRGSPRIALDTEFVGEESFVPKLELIQVASHHVAAVIDFQCIQTNGPLASFWELLCDPQIEKVVHAGRQDLDLIATHTGRIPRPFFDTQIAAAMLGYGPQIAYANLVQRIYGTKLAKAHTFTNWSARPLSQEQITYAAEDVKFLLAIHDHLYRRLDALGRVDWVREEFARLETTVGEKNRDPLERYQRIRGWDSLKPRQAAVLRDLAAWRETEARRRNIPRGRVMRDEVLLQIARHPPKTVDELRGMRGVHSSEIDRNGEQILSTITSALALPPSVWPTFSRERKPEPDSRGLVELLQAILRARSLELEIAPTLLATSADLQALVEAGGKRMALDLPILRGWRRQLMGELLLQILNGQLSVSIDPAKGILRIAGIHDSSALP